MPLSVSVLNSDLAFVHEPLVIGHYTSLGLTGSEEAVGLNAVLVGSSAWPFETSRAIVSPFLTTVPAAGNWSRIVPLPSSRIRSSLRWPETSTRYFRTINSGLAV